MAALLRRLARLLGRRRRWHRVTVITNVRGILP